MSDLEYDVLDQLYFVQSFIQLNESLHWDEDMLRDTLEKLLKKGWIKCYSSPTEGIPEDEIDFPIQYRKYFYLATKEGLFAHNTTDYHD